MKKLLCTFVFLFSVNIILAQDKPEKKKSKKFLPAYESFSLVNLGLGLNIDLPTTITDGSLGGSMDIGFNIAKFFNREVLLAPYAGFSVVSTQSYKTGFLQRLQSEFAGFPTEYTNLADEESLSFLSSEERGLVESYEQAADEYNNITNNNIKTKVSLYYGIMLKLPGRYIPLMKFYRSHHYISGKVESRPVGFISYDPGDFDPFADSAGEIDRKGMGLEIDLFTGWFASTLQHVRNARLGQVSIYLERYDLKSLEIGNKVNYGDYSINKIPLTSFFDSSETFTKAYSKEVRVGIKIGLSIL